MSIDRLNGGGKGIELALKTFSVLHVYIFEVINPRPPKITPLLHVINPRPPKITPLLHVIC